MLFRSASQNSVPWILLSRSRTHFQKIIITAYLLLPMKLELPFLRPILFTQEMPTQLLPPILSQPTKTLECTISIKHFFISTKIAIIHRQLLWIFSLQSAYLQNMDLGEFLITLTKLTKLPLTPNSRLF